MSRNTRQTVAVKPLRTLWGTDVTLHAIRSYARQVAEQFHPDQIILFGSHAYGTPTPDSDVDLLVVMATRNPISQAVKIRLALPARFPMDLIVRSPQMLAQRVEWGDSFLTEVVTKGKVLYEKSNVAVGPKSRSRLPSLPRDRSQHRTVS